MVSVGYTAINYFLYVVADNNRVGIWHKHQHIQQVKCREISTQQNSMLFIKATTQHGTLFFPNYHHFYLLYGVLLLLNVQACPQLVSCVGTLQNDTNIACLQLVSCLGTLQNDANIVGLKVFVQWKMEIS